MSVPPNNRNNPNNCTNFVKSGNVSLSGTIADKLAGALGQDPRALQERALRELLSADPMDPEIRARLRSSWKAHEGVRPKRWEQWDCWWTDVTECPHIIDNTFVPFGWTHIYRGRGTVKEYFKPRLGVIVSPAAIHTQWKAWLCPTFHEPRGLISEAVLQRATGERSTALLCLTRSVSLDEEPDQMLQFCEPLKAHAIAESVAKLNTLWAGRDGSIRPGAVVADAPGENGLVIGASYAGPALGEVLITCLEADVRPSRPEQELSAYGLMTGQCASGQMRVFDTTELIPVQRHAVNQIDEVSEEVTARIRSAFRKAIS